MIRKGVYKNQGKDTKDRIKNFLKTIETEKRTNPKNAAQYSMCCLKYDPKRGI